MLKRSLLAASLGLAVLALAPTAHAQSRNSIEIRQSGYANELAARVDGHRNRLSLEQRGVRQFISTLQDGTRNGAQVSQEGGDNQAGLSQQGRRNRVVIGQEAGSTTPSAPSPATAMSWASPRSGRVIRRSPIRKAPTMRWASSRSAAASSPMCIRAVRAM